MGSHPDVSSRTTADILALAAAGMIALPALLAFALRPHRKPSRPGAFAGTMERAVDRVSRHILSLGSTAGYAAWS